MAGSVSSGQPGGFSRTRCRGRWQRRVRTPQRTESGNADKRPRPAGRASRPRATAAGHDVTTSAEAIEVENPSRSCPIPGWNRRKFRGILRTVTCQLVRLRRLIAVVSGLAFAGVFFARILAAAPDTQAATTRAVESRALLDQYCVTCHNDRLKTANLSLEKLDLSTVGDHPELWEKVIRKLRAGVMPPPDIKRPSLAEYESIRDFLEAEIDRKAAPRASPGAV